MDYYQKLESIKFKSEQNINEILRKKEEIKKDDVGIIHPSVGSGVIIRDSGNIDIFADNGLGIQINPSKKTISLYASKIKFFCSDFKVMNENEINYEIKDDWKEIIRLLDGE